MNKKYKFISKKNESVKEDNKKNKKQKKEEIALDYKSYKLVLQTKNQFGAVDRDVIKASLRDGFREIIEDVRNDKSVILQYLKMNSSTFSRVIRHSDFIGLTEDELNTLFGIKMIIDDSLDYLQIIPSVKSKKTKTLFISKGKL